MQDHYLDLFSPETYEAFSRSDRTVSGFRSRQLSAAKRVKPGDRLVCYLTRLSRWIGLLEVVSGPYEESSPIFLAEADPFVIRFKVKPLVWLPVQKGIPIHDPAVWKTLTYTRNRDESTSNWTGKLRVSLAQLDRDDAAFLQTRLLEQSKNGGEYALNDDDQKKLKTHRVRGLEGTVSVSVPEDHDPVPTEEAPEDVVRESIEIQALLAKIGSAMGMRIWLPAGDRIAVLKRWTPKTGELLDSLPLNYDETTLKTIERIDVLWLKGRAIARAFEVEHTTAIYSGILRMADLLALQPNMDIRLHIVAPEHRREKVFDEIRRPVFSLIDRGPLSSRCSLLSYDSVREVADQKHLAHLSDSVLDEYAEEAE